MTNKDWDLWYIEQAQKWASKSKDKSTKVGAVIVGPDNEPIAAGYNGMPRKVDDDIAERHISPNKYHYFEHAERNAIYNAMRAKASVTNCTMYMNYEPYPCADCTRGIIQIGGIVEIVGPNIPFPGKGEQWEASLNASKEMLKEAGIKVRIIDVNTGLEELCCDPSVCDCQSQK